MTTKEATFRTAREAFNQLQQNINNNKDKAAVANLSTQLSTKRATMEAAE